MPPMEDETPSGGHGTNPPCAFPNHQVRCAALPFGSLSDYSFQQHRALRPPVAGSIPGKPIMGLRSTSLFPTLLALVLLSAPLPASTDRDAETAVFAGGCFWCMQPPYDSLDGVLHTEVGFTGGDVENPSYEQVTAGGTGHVEAVRVLYDPEVVDYETLLEVFWRNIDPLDDGGQFCDRGAHYRSAIFVGNDAQRRAAETSKAELEASERFGKPIVTEMHEAGPFYLAEDRHQDYYLKNPLRYRYYRMSCRRDARLKELWGD